VAVVLPFDPENPLNLTKLNTFRAHYGIDQSVDLLGPYSGMLNAAGETVELLRPDDPPPEEPTFIPMLLEDQVIYSDQAPWPTEPDGLGPSLTRKRATNWGNDPESWRGDVDGSPGTFTSSNEWLLSVSPAFGNPTPAAGSHVYPAGSIITARVDSVVTQGLTRYVSTGWQLLGQEPSAGAAQSFTLTLTNRVDFIWQWETNQYLSVSSGSGGVVLVTNGWYQRGAVTIAQAVPAPSNRFVEWLGDLSAITAGSPTSEVIEITMANPVSLTAVFTDGFHDLIVSSEHGSPSPSVGLHTLPHGTMVNASVEAQISVGENQLTCSGWLMSGTIHGAGTNAAVSFTLSGDQTLTWLWVTSSWLDVEAESGGSVSGGGWQSLGSVVEVSASPESGYGFFRWVGDTSSIVAGDQYTANISVLMTSSLQLTAEFCQLVDGTDLSRNGDFETQGSLVSEAYDWEMGSPDLNGGRSGTASREGWRSHDGGLWEATIRGTWADVGTDEGKWWQIYPAYEGVTYS
ncbi:MAG: hypothetical protein KDL10_09155, partial [Kiritimatiellae bacterium]|nr:hypothetical protein [Kiritimatiellia bacterium]